MLVVKIIKLQSHSKRFELIKTRHETGRNKMMKKILTIGMLSTALLCSSVSFAESLEHNMEALAKNYKAFNKSENQKDALIALDNMRIAALDAKKVKLKTPNKKALTSDALYDQIVGQIDKTKGLVNAGQLEQAKVEGKKLAAIRDQGHQIYHNH